MVDGATFDAQSGLELSTDVRGGQAGDVSVIVRNGGTLTGAAFLASADSTANDPGGTGTAGDVSILVDNGTFRFTDIPDPSPTPTPTPSLRVSANGFGRGNDTSNSPEDRGLGLGGNISVTLQNNGVISLETASFASDGFHRG